MASLMLRAMEDDYRACIASEVSFQRRTRVLIEAVLLLLQ